MSNSIKSSKYFAITADQVSFHENEASKANKHLSL